MSNAEVLARVARAALLVVAGSLASQVAAQSATERTIERWLLRCETAAKGSTRCRMIQTVGLKPRGQRVLTIVIARDGSDAMPVAHFTVPLGIYLPAGLTLQVDDAEPLRVPIEQCTASGCATRMQLDDALVRRLREGSAAKYVFQNAERKDISITAPLQGFDRAFAELK